MKLNKFNIIIYGFFSLLFIAIFFASLFENFVERIITNYLAPGAFYSVIFIYFIYLIITTVSPLFKKGESSVKEDTIYNLLIIGSLSGVLVAYSTSKSTEKVINNNMGIMVEKYVNDNDKSIYVKEEIGELNKNIEDLREGNVLIDGLQNVRLKLRDYVVKTKTDKIDIILSVDNWIIENKELKEFLKYIDGLNRVVPNFKIYSYVFSKDQDNFKIREYFKEFTHFKLYLEDFNTADYNRNVSEIVNRHHQTIFGIMGNYDCIFLITPSGQLNNEFQAKFLIKSSSDIFNEYKGTLKNGINQFINDTSSTAINH
jgi:hypothetical protein